MPGWNGKRIATFGLICGMALLDAGFQVGCHKSSKQDNSLQPPSQLNYASPTMLPTAGVLFTSVAPTVHAHLVNNGIGSTIYTGFTFSVSPALPAGLGLDPGTGVITGTATDPGSDPAVTANYAITAHDGAGSSVPFIVALGVQATSAVQFQYAIPPIVLPLPPFPVIPFIPAVSMAVGGLFPGLGIPDVRPTVADGSTVGFGISPALPAGLVLGDNGVISGKPTLALKSPQVFTVTVTTENGSANTQFTLLVTATAPALSSLAYPALSAATHGAAYAGPTPTVMNLGQTVTVTPDLGLLFTVAPALPAGPAWPAGLTLDLQTGAITGTPVAAAAQANYVITASSANGPLSTTVSLAVN